MYTIVIAWKRKERAVTSTAGYDLGRRPEIVEFDRGYAAVWLNRGTVEDAAAAQKYADTEVGYRVFLYPTNEKHLLVRARKEILNPGFQYGE